MAKKGNERLTDTVESLRPYIERALKDDEFRANVREAVDAARGVYGDLSKANGLTKSAAKLATDKDVHGNLQRALAELTDAVERVQGTRGRKRRKGLCGQSRQHNPPPEILLLHHEQLYIVRTGATSTDAPTRSKTAAMVHSTTHRR